MLETWLPAHGCFLSFLSLMRRKYNLINPWLAASASYFNFYSCPRYSHLYFTLMHHSSSNAWCKSHCADFLSVALGWCSPRSLELVHFTWTICWALVLKTLAFLLFKPYNLSRHTNHDFLLFHWNFCFFGLQSWLMICSGYTFSMEELIFWGSR